MAWEALCQPHVTPVNCRGLESSGGQSGKWGKGRSVAPAAAVRQGPREEDGRRPAGPETPTGRRLPGCRPPREGGTKLVEARRAQWAEAPLRPPPRPVPDRGFCSLGPGFPKGGLPGNGGPGAGAAAQGIWWV